LQVSGLFKSSTDIADLHHFDAYPDPPFYFSVDSDPALHLLNGSKSATNVAYRVHASFVSVRGPYGSIWDLQSSLKLINFNADSDPPFELIRIQFFTLMRIRIRLTQKYAALLMSRGNCAEKSLDNSIQQFER
jgi:hypothetical protein